MDLERLVKAVAIAVLIVLTIFGNCRIIVKLGRNNDMDPQLRRIILLVAVSGFLSGTFNLGTLLISSIPDDWLLGSLACQGLAFGGVTLSTGAAWMIALASAERYYKIIVPSEHLSMFSTKNMKILVVGLYLLAIMAATGPFYGFGEYTYLRGQLKLIVTANISVKCDDSYTCANRTDKDVLVKDYFTYLQRKSIAVPPSAILPKMAYFLMKTYNIIISRALMGDESMTFHFRCKSKVILETIWNSFSNCSMARFLENANVTDTQWRNSSVKVNLYPIMSHKEYEEYKDVHLPVQDLGICAADMTSPNCHSFAWSGYYVIIASALPYFFMLVCFVVIYFRYPSSMNLSDRHVTEKDVWITNIMCTTGVICSTLSFLYFAVICSNTFGLHIAPNVVYMVTCSYHSSGIVLFIVCNFSDFPVCLNCRHIMCRNIIHNCRRYAREALSYDMSEIELKRTISQDSSSKKTFVTFV